MVTQSFAVVLQELQPNIDEAFCRDRILVPVLFVAYQRLLLFHRSKHPLYQAVNCIVQYPSCYNHQVTRRININNIGAVTNMHE